MYKGKLIRLLLLSLSLSSLFCHPAPTQDPSEALCSTLKTLGQSLEDARLHGPLCVDSELLSKHCLHSFRVKFSLFFS